jgi:hypothetical protein
MRLKLIACVPSRCRADLRRFKAEDPGGGLLHTLLAHDPQQEGRRRATRVQRPQAIPGMSLLGRASPATFCVLPWFLLHSRHAGLPLVGHVRSLQHVHQCFS